MLKLSSLLLFITLSVAVHSAPTTSPIEILFTKKSLPLSTKWKTQEGHEFSLPLVAASQDTTYFRRVHKTIPISLEKLSLESQIISMIWLSSNGLKYSLPACSLIYLHNPNKAKNFTQKVTIHYDGSHRVIAELPLLGRTVSYDHEKLEFSVFRSTSDKAIATGQPTSSEHELAPQCKPVEEWHPATVRNFAGRFLSSPEFPSGHLIMANASAPAITSLLSILNGQHLYYSSGNFGLHSTDFKINSLSKHPTESFELERAVKLAHHWEMLPLRLQWKSKVTKHKGLLELVSIKPLESGRF